MFQCIWINPLCVTILLIQSLCILEIFGTSKPYLYLGAILSDYKFAYFTNRFVSFDLFANRFSVFHSCSSSKMTRKVRSMWSYIYDNYCEKYDWFHIGYVATYSSNELSFFEHHYF